MINMPICSSRWRCFVWKSIPWLQSPFRFTLLGFVGVTRPSRTIALTFKYHSYYTADPVNHSVAGRWFRLEHAMQCNYSTGWRWPFTAVSTRSPTDRSVPVDGDPFWRKNCSPPERKNNRLQWNEALSGRRSGASQFTTCEIQTGWME